MPARRRCRTTASSLAPSWRRSRVCRRLDARVACHVPLATCPPQHRQRDSHCPQRPSLPSPAHPPQQADRFRFSNFAALWLHPAPASAKSSLPPATLTPAPRFAVTSLPPAHVARAPDPARRVCIGGCTRVSHATCQVSGVFHRESPPRPSLPPALSGRVQVAGDVAGAGQLGDLWGWGWGWSGDVNRTLGKGVTRGVGNVPVS